MIIVSDRIHVTENSKFSVLAQNNLARKRQNILSSKIYVIDTNVLMYAGKKALTGFEEHEVVIPFAVIEELESKKNDLEQGFMARYALAEIDSLRENGNIRKGIIINKMGGTLRIELNHIEMSTLPAVLKKLHSGSGNDNRILAVANNIHLDEQSKKAKGLDYKEVVFVSNDIALRIKADSVLDFTIEPFRLKATEYGGIKNATVDHEVIGKLYNAGEHKVLDAPDNLINLADGVYNHAFLLSAHGANKTSCVALLRNNTISLANLDNNVQKLQGKSVEQKLAMSYVQNPHLPIVSISGSAGTGKTLIAVATGLDKVAKEEYNKVVVIRPIYAVGGQDIGHLPGDLDDKMAEWRKPIYDSVEGILQKDVLEKLQEQNKLDVMPVTFIRGRTFNNSFVIVDEAQNFEPTVLLTILSRIGYNSKIVFLWDATQKDNNRIGYNQGIISVVEKLKSHSMFVHITLKKSERSPIAELAGEILKDYVN